MDMPPSRYRVVERGRQLVVIDTRPQGAVCIAEIARLPPGDALNPAIGKTIEASAAPVSRDRSGMGMFAQVGGSMSDALVRRDGAGNAEYLDTHRWFDDQGPRRVRLSSAGRERLNVAILGILGGLGVGVLGALLVTPLVWIVGLTLLSAKSRASIRAQITRWIDGLGTTEPR